MILTVVDKTVGFKLSMAESGRIETTGHIEVAGFLETSYLEIRTW